MAISASDASGQDSATTPDSEKTFFFVMAIVVAATAIIGFSFARLIGLSSFGAPWWVHVHALIMMSWVGLFLAQTGFIWQGNRAAHRRLGRIGAVWIGWMLMVGLLTTAWSLGARRAPPFFDPVFFLAMDWLNMIAFAAMAWAGIALRHRTDWHRRLMLGATIIVIGPAWGRLMPLPILREGVVWPISGLLLLYFGAGLIYDLRTRGRVHPAYGVGVAVLAAFVLLIRPIAAIPAFAELAHKITG